MLRCVAAVSLALLLCIGLGCRSAPRPSTDAASSGPVAHTADPRSVSAFSGWDGRPVSWDSLLSLAAEADIVIIGEQHGHPLGLAVAAAMWDDLLPRTVAAALSLEFFERDDQSRIDDYLAGLSDEATFLRRSGRSESNYPSGHRQMLEAARAANRPVHAANAPRAVVRHARRHGFDALAGLTEEQRRLFRLPDHEPRGRYREDFEKLMREALAGAHGVETGDQEARDRMVEAMLRSQTLWDWTMAHTIVRAMQSGDVPVVHVVGRFHSDFGGGLVQAIEHLAPHARIVTVSMADRWADELLEEDLGRADVVFYVGPEAL